MFSSVTVRRISCLWAVCIVVAFFAFLRSPVIVFASSENPVDFLSDEFYSEEAESQLFNDPLEPVNRVIFKFNDTLYIWVMDPIATAYSKVLPADIRGCINSFFRNLQEPVRFINTLLQGRFSDSGRVLVRFVINSTLGIYGFADAAANDFDFPPVEATMGETLESWGVGDGLYLVIPLYGPSTLREISGDLVDAIEMTPYYSWSDDLAVDGAIYFGKETNHLSFHLGEYEEWKKMLFDPYVSFRNAYFQYRRRVRSHPRR